MRDLLSDLNNYACLENDKYASDTVNDVALPLFLWYRLALARCEFNFKTIFYIYVQNFFYLHIFSFFSDFKHDFIRCVDFTLTTASIHSKL